MRDVGKYIPIKMNGRSFEAFVPRPLPPEPPLDFSPEDTELLARAEAALTRLDSFVSQLPDAAILLRTFVRKEAVYSSRIEGMMSSVNDLLLFKSSLPPSVPLDDVLEVDACAASIEYGLRVLRDGQPLSLRLIREAHGILLKDSDKSPGVYRNAQVYIGSGAKVIFVPPPPLQVAECMDELEKFFNSTTLPPLVKAGLAHVQFETIHPFIDGNGRTGRLLIALMLIADGKLSAPFFSLSTYLMRHRPQYYMGLNLVRSHGDWEGWMRHFLLGIELSAGSALVEIRHILDLFEKDSASIRSLATASDTTAAVYEFFKMTPIATADAIVAALKLPQSSVQDALHMLLQLRIITEFVKSDKAQVFSYAAYVEILNDES